MQHFNLICNEAQSTADISREKYANLRDDALTKIEEAQSHVKEDMENVRFANQVLSQQFVKRVEVSQKQLQDFLAGFQIARELFEQQLRQLRHDMEQEVSGLSSQFSR
jgi:hypothetical protein